MKDLYIYNVTTMVNHSIHDEWLKWMKEEHIPEVISSGMFTHHRMLRLLETDETEGITYATQYFCNSMQNYNHYTKFMAPQLRKKVSEKWGDQALSFRTLMEVIN